MLYIMYKIARLIALDKNGFYKMNLAFYIHSTISYTLFNLYNNIEHELSRSQWYNNNKYLSIQTVEYVIEWRWDRLK